MSCFSGSQCISKFKTLIGNFARQKLEACNENEFLNRFVVVILRVVNVSWSWGVFFAYQVDRGITLSMILDDDDHKLQRITWHRGLLIIYLPTRASQLASQHARMILLYLDILWLSIPVAISATRQEPMIN